MQSPATSRHDEASHREEMLERIQELLKSGGTISIVVTGTNDREGQQFSFSTSRNLEPDILREAAVLLSNPGLTKAIQDYYSISFFQGRVLSRGPIGMDPYLFYQLAPGIAKKFTPNIMICRESLRWSAPHGAGTVRSELMTVRLT